MLYVCPTPIGNLGDVTRRVIETLAAVDLVACEDTRRTGRLLAHLGIDRPLLSFFEHNEVRRVETILERLRAGDSVALVSDAGMPGISDPGYTLIRAALDEGLPVTVLPGPSVVGLAVVASGLPTDRFAFVGYLPRGAGRLSSIEQADLAGGTVVAFESPARLPKTLAALAERWPQRRLAVCREMTKLHEQVERGTAAEVAAVLTPPVRGEIVLVLAPAERGPEDVAAESVDRVLAALLADGASVKDASRVVADLSGLPGRGLYDRALRLRRGGV